MKNRSAKISLDKNVLRDLPYFNTQIKINEADKNRGKEAIFDKIIKQLLPNNDQYYIKHDKKNDSFTIKKEKRRGVKRKLTVETVAANKIKNKYAERRRNSKQ